MSGAFQPGAFYRPAFQLAPVAGPYTATLLVNGVDVTGPTEWSMTWEERADGSPGTFSAVIQNRHADDFVFGVTQRERVNLTLSSGFILYDGEVVNSTLDLPVGQIGRWNLKGTDWNTVPDLRLVGVPSGGTWLSTDGGLTFLNVDPNAQNGPTDAVTIAELFDAYVRKPGVGWPFPSPPTPFNTSAYVGNYVSGAALLNPHTGEPTLQWSHSTLHSALDDVRSLATSPVYFWIDPAGFVHWKTYADMSSPAPAAITDDHPDGVTSIGCRALSFGFDASYMPQDVWVNGVTDYIYNGGDVIAQGTGWGAGPFDVADPGVRQISVDAQSASVAQREAVYAAYTKYNAQAKVKIQLTIGGRLDEGPVIDGWRCGQSVQITDARLPASLNGLSWPIQRVQGSLKAGRPETRQYVLECGDMPIGSFFAKYRTNPKTIVTPRKPAYTWEIYFQNLAPAPGEAQTLVLQALDSSKKSVRAPGLTCNVTLTVTLAGAPFTSDASVSPASAVSNADGQVAIIFTADSTTGGLTYKVDAATPAVT